MLDQLRAERAHLKPQLDYTIGGAIETTVHTDIEKERDQNIKDGEHTLQQALHEMRREQALSSHSGLAKAHFNHTNQEM